MQDRLQEQQTLGKADIFSTRLWRWLDQFGFKHDPFAVWEADQERPALHYFFVDRPYLHNIIGDPTYPQVALLMAGRGEGKTATREMVAYECEGGQLRRRALPVRYYDFGLVLEQVNGDLSRVTARQHVHAVARLILRALAEDVPATYFELLKPEERNLLMCYADAFAHPLSIPRLKQLLPGGEPLQLAWESLSARETLESLAFLVTRLGQTAESRYQAVYVLVDGVDETPAGPDAAVALLRPLVGDMLLLNTPQVGFKFFLSKEVGERLRQVVPIRPDRICLQTITWDESSLVNVVRERLRYFSEERIQKLEDLCTIAAKSAVMERLINACEGSPRTLIRLCQALIHQHARHADAASNLLIDRADIFDALADFSQRLEAERTPAVSAVTRPVEAGIAPPETGLFIDDNGHVWTDGKQVSPSLSDMEFRLLKALYRQSPEIVPNEALIKALWNTTASMDDQNLRKLVVRLRRRLEPDEEGRPRFIQNARGRGYWLKKS